MIVFALYFAYSDSLVITFLIFMGYGKKYNDNKDFTHRDFSVKTKIRKANNNDLNWI